jgi:O-antigen/teichoic acid export membrane protein
LPSTLVPIIVLNKLGAAQAAYFYMPMQMAMFLNIISSSTSQALMSEASQADDHTLHRAHFQNAFKHLYMMLLPAIVLLCALGWPILRIYGAAYVHNGFALLLFLAGASVFVAVNWLGDTLLNIQRRSGAYFLMNALNALLVVTAVWLGAAHGLIGVGLGWLLAQAGSAVVYIAIFARSQALHMTTQAYKSVTKPRTGATL